MHVETGNCVLKLHSASFQRLCRIAWRNGMCLTYAYKITPLQIEEVDMSAAHRDRVVVGADLEPQMT
jgi:hypothetical protein